MEEKPRYPGVQTKYLYNKISRGPELYSYKISRGPGLYSYKILRGSEHQIGGRPFPLELHLVHFNSKYEEIGENSNFL